MLPRLRRPVKVPRASRVDDEDDEDDEDKAASELSSDCAMARAMSRDSSSASSAPPRDRDTYCVRRGAYDGAPRL